MQHDQLDELLKPLVRQARVLTPHRSRAAESAGTETKFGGAPYAEAGDGWPECRTCKNDLVFVAQLRDDSLNGLLVFFYCFECFPWGLDNEEEGQWVIRHYAAPSGDRLEKIVPAREQQFTVNPCAVSESR